MTAAPSTTRGRYAADESSAREYLRPRHAIGLGLGFAGTSATLVLRPRRGGRGFSPSTGRLADHDTCLRRCRGRFRCRLLHDSPHAPGRCRLPRRRGSRLGRVLRFVGRQDHAVRTRSGYRDVRRARRRAPDGARCCRTNGSSRGQRHRSRGTNVGRSRRDRRSRRPGRRSDG